MSDFVHLHLHTQYSVLDGANKIKDVIAQAAAYKQSAVAMTDHGNMHGAIEFYQEAVAHGIKPIIGCEVYITTGSRFDRTPRSQGGPTTHHLTLLAKNKVGYQNLCRLVSLGFQEGFYFKPRIDREILAQYSEGLICLSGCMSGEFGTHCHRDDFEGAREIARWHQSVFGERYFLEVQPHALAEQKKINTIARSLGNELGIPLVATNDCHYISRDDHYAQEVLMCISTGKLITDEGRIKHTGSQLHFKNYHEMVEGLPEFEDALRHSVAIAETCNVEFDFKSHHLPRVEPPADKTIEDYFSAEASAGLKRRFAAGNGYFTPERRTQYDAHLQREIEVIINMGFAGYFLVVSDFVRWAKGQDIPVGPGRGSAAGSLVAFAMEITEIDPIRYNLLFERFLNPERISLPDIDVDFCMHGRDRVIEYVCNKYGRDRVAQIVTFGTLKAKAAIKDVGRVLGLSYAETDRIAKLVPAPRQGFDYPLQEAIAMEKRLREFAEGEGRDLIQLALKLEGLTRHTSTHAAGVVIADRPVVEFMPLMLDKDNQVVSQFSMNGVEKIGLVKFDFLGLKTLTVLDGVVRLIAEAFPDKPRININAIPLDDPKTYRQIASARTIGVFQLESSGITDMVSRLRPNCFEDLVAILALYRPGPLDAGMVDHYINRKHGREPVHVLHPILEPILKDTYGIILYQEQIMQIARDMAGYSLGDADILRRAMGKKKPEEMAKQREIFVRGSKARGVSESVATEVFNQMETFARYGFNRSHSVAYALISYQTAYLKAHYPLYFMAALMTLEMDDTDKILKNLNECREMEIEVVPPDINRGNVGFSVVDGRVLFGLAAIKGVGEKIVQRIISEREKNGPFKSLLDFCNRVDSSVLNKRSLEHFIKSGAFDWTELSRAELSEQCDEVVAIAERNRNAANSKQIGLFDVLSSSQEEKYTPKRALLPEWPINVKLSHEKAALGFYLSGHPLERFQQELARFGMSTISALGEMNDGAAVSVAGVVTVLKLKNTKKGDRYATFFLEDLRDTIEVIVWPDVYQKTHEILQSDDPVVLTGRLDVTDERRIVIAAEVQSAIALREKTAREAIVTLSADRADQQKVKELYALLRKHRGECAVKLVIRQRAHSETMMVLPDDMKVEPTEALCNMVERLFGEPVLTFR